MKLLIAFLLTLILLDAKTYMGIIEPVRSFNIFAQAQGEIVELDDQDEHKLINKRLLLIDQSLDMLRLKSLSKQLRIARDEEVIHRTFYENTRAIAGKSQNEKDTLHLAYLAQQSKVADLELKVAELEDTLAKKEIKIANLYIKELFVHLHDYVTAGTKVAHAYDVSQGKVVLFVHKDEVQDLDKKSILIDGKPSTARLKKYDLSLDANYVSSHKVEIHLDDTRFGTLIEVEFVEKDKD